MDTIVKENEVKTAEKANGSVNVKSGDKKEAFVQGNPINKESVKPQETAKASETKPTVPVGQATDPAGKPDTVRNLDGTLKLVEELYRKKVQREKIQETINNLDAFEFDLKGEAEDIDGNHFQNCILTIEDDNRRKFITKNPTIIWTVSQMVNNLCVNKLAEIEAAIILPQ